MACDEMGRALRCRMPKIGCNPAQSVHLKTGKRDLCHQGVSILFTDSKDISNGILHLRRTGEIKIFDRCPLLKPNGGRATISIASGDRWKCIGRQPKGKMEILVEVFTRRRSRTHFPRAERPQ
jgi:hypothetical protein